MKTQFILGLVLVAIILGSVVFYQLFTRRPSESMTNSLNTEEIDPKIKEVMSKFSVDIGQFALIKSDKLLYSTALTIKNVGLNKTNLFRIFQLSMTITAVAILKLVEEEKLSLWDRVFNILDYNISNADPLVSEITIDQLLTHTSGWDTTTSTGPWYNTVNDVAFRDQEIASSKGMSVPISGNDVINYQLTIPLAVEPGQLFSVNHVNYILLEKVIEKISSQSYYEFVKTQILQPLGINMKIGKTEIENADPLEVQYKNAFPQDNCPSVMQDNRMDKCAYAVFNIDKMPGAVGWISNIDDLATFLLAIDGRGDDIVDHNLLTEKGNNFNHPRFDYYARGVQMSDNGMSNYGIALGTSAYFYQYNEYILVFLFNKHPVQIELPQNRSFHNELVEAVRPLLE